MTTVDNGNEIQPSLTLKQRAEAVGGTLMAAAGSALYLYSVLVHPEKMSNPELIGLGAVALVTTGGLILAGKLRQRFPPKDKQSVTRPLTQENMTAAMTELEALAALQKQEQIQQ